MGRLWLLLLFGFLAIVSSSCNERQTTTVSVGHDFKSGGNGKIAAMLDAEHEKLELRGDLELIYGEFLIWLANPEGDTVFSRSFHAVYNQKWDTTFSAVPGEWTFGYQILKYEDLNPSGTFRFSLIY